MGIQQWKLWKTLNSNHGTIRKEIENIRISDFTFKTDFKSVAKRDWKNEKGLSKKRDRSRRKWKQSRNMQTIS